MESTEAPVEASMKKRTSKELKAGIRQEILHNFGSGFEPVPKASYTAIRLIGETENCAAIFGAKGGQSLWIKSSAQKHLPEVVETKDVSTYGRGFQFKIEIADEEDPNLGLAVLAVKHSLSNTGEFSEEDE